MAKKPKTATPAPRRGNGGHDQIEARRRFVRRASHDLRQPLAALKLLLYDLEQNLEDPQQQHLVEVMTSSVTMMQRFVQNLIEYESLTAGLAEPDPEPILVEALFQDLKDRLSQDERAKAATLRIAPSRRAVLADKAMLDLCIGHLVENAFTHGGAGGKVLLGARPAGKAVRIEIWDQGPGLSGDDTAEIFQPFRHAATAGAGGGSLGLGLAIAESCARQMDARIDVCSREGRGSRFSVTLPAASRPALSRQTALPLGGQPSPFLDKAILMAGHDSDERQEARALLERWGAQVWDGEDPNAHEALRQRRIEPDLAVLFGPLPQDVAPSHFARSVTRAFGKRPPTIFLCDRRPSPKTLGDAWFLPAPVKPAAFRSLATHLLRQGDAGDASAPPGQD
jgi:anti-sigma regulatory factor (Ser/Thr protein kinase)